MSAEKTEGIVLRVIEFSETSCIVTLMTRDFGKITAMAKGARRPKSPFEAALDVLALCRIVFLHKTSGAMSLLTEAKLDRRFRSSSTNLKRLYAGYYIVELLNVLTDEGDSNPELFDLAVKTIYLIDSDQIEDAQLNRHLMEFELKALDLLGHLPMLTKCVSCGREKTTLDRVHFGLNDGGILCQTCRRGKSNIVSVSGEGLKLLLDLVGGQIGTDQANSDNWNQLNRVSENRVANYQVDFFNTESIESKKRLAGSSDNLVAVTKPVESSQSLGEVRSLVNKYITHLLGYPPKLHKFLKNI